METTLGVLSFNPRPLASLSDHDRVAASGVKRELSVSELEFIIHVSPCNNHALGEKTARLGPSAGSESAGVKNADTRALLESY